MVHFFAQRESGSLMANAKRKVVHFSRRCAGGSLSSYRLLKVNHFGQALERRFTVSPASCLKIAQAVLKYGKGGDNVKFTNLNWVKHVSGLPTNPVPNEFTIMIEDEELLIHQLKLGILNDTLLNTYRIPLKNIVEFEVVTRKLQKGYSGVGMSSTMSISPTYNVTETLEISYIPYGKPDEVKNFAFNLKGFASTTSNIQYFKKMKKDIDEFLKKPEEQFGIENSDGSISL